MVWTMKNRTVVEEWVKHMLDGIFKYKPLKGKNLYGIDNYLVSYNTPICEYNNCIFICSTKYYSITTQRHRFYLNEVLMNLKQTDPRIVSESIDELKGQFFL